ncbi:MAG: biopolymer transporter ExbD [Bacteroidaceae bacterium]|nr:biopolymer transporter ExbD [Bacteroidaceae bacterium]MCF0199395.1 biopolymer transporter ExbD [Bacteroidaceae bacterium]
MGKKKKKVPGLNTSSTADISFMLLIFFLITTSMDTDKGLERRLPKPPENEDVKQEMKIKERNVMEVRLNSQGQVWVKDGGSSEFLNNVAELRNRAKEFVKNEQNLPHFPEKHAKFIEGLGQCFVTDKHVISVQTAPDTPYWIYFYVQNELVAAYNELRDDLSKQKFGGREYSALSDEQKVAVRAYYPQNISEAEPKKYN